VDSVSPHPKKLIYIYIYIYNADSSGVILDLYFNQERRLKRKGNLVLCRRKRQSRSGRIDGNDYDNSWDKYSQEVKEKMTGKKQLNNEIRKE
jgi:hypothetical protein